MILYSLIGVASFFLITTIGLAIYISKVKSISDFYKIRLEEEILKSESLNQDRDQLLVQNTSLKEKLNHASNSLVEREKLIQEAFHGAKSSLYELGTELSKNLISNHKKESEEARKITEERLSITQQRLHEQFENIVQKMSVLGKDFIDAKSTVELIKNSLLSPSGAGALAEITLENLLKSSGLRKGLDFEIQHHMDLQSGILRPDAVIFLPGDNIMIIDSKASKFFVEFEPREDNDRLLVKTMQTHLKSLTNKDYKEAIKEDLKKKSKTFNNVITLMFLPSEQCVEKLSNLNNEFMFKSWEYAIFPVGPTGLMNMLSFAKYQIAEHMRSENQKEILEEVRKLLGSIGQLNEFGRKIGQNLQSLVSNYDKFAASFNRNFLSKASNIAKLGIEPPHGKDVRKPLSRLQTFVTDAEVVEGLEQEEQKTDLLLHTSNDKEEI